MTFEKMIENVVAINHGESMPRETMKGIAHRIAERFDGERLHSRYSNEGWALRVLGTKIPTRGI